MKTIHPQIKSIMKVHKFSLYVQKNDSLPKPRKIPVHPVWDGDLVKFSKNKKFIIGETIMNYELSWFIVKYENGEEVWICDRVLVNNVSRNMLTEYNGLKFEVEGVKGKLSLPKMGLSQDDSCEWMDLINFLSGDPENYLHWKNCYSFGLERCINTINTKDTNGVVLRGYTSPKHWVKCDASTHYNSAGWRPVIRIFKNIDLK